jgi:translation initiation factor IF-3
MSRHKKQTKVEKGPRKNEEIKEAQLRLVDEEGKMLGLVSTSQAIEMANEKGN